MKKSTRAAKAQSDLFPSSIEQRFLRCICSLGVLSEALEHQGNTDSCLTVKLVASELYTVYEELAP